MTALPFIEFTCEGGRIGRIEWTNTNPRMVGPRMFCSGAWGSVRWWEPWPVLMASWPVTPWGPADWERDGPFADFAVFEASLPDGLDDLKVAVRIDLYDWACRVHDHGIQAGRDPWAAARLPRLQRAGQADVGEG